MGGMQATGTRPCTWGAPARRRPCSPPSSAPPQARLTAEAPSPRPRPSPCPRPTAPATQRGVGPAGRSPRGRGPRGAAPHLAAPLRRVSGWGRPRAGEDASLQTQRRQAETHSTGRLHAELRTPKPTVGGPRGLSAVAPRGRVDTAANSELSAESRHGQARPELHAGNERLPAGTGHPPPGRRRAGRRGEDRPGTHRLRGAGRWPRTGLPRQPA